MAPSDTRSAMGRIFKDGDAYVSIPHFQEICGFTDGDGA